MSTASGSSASHGVPKRLRPDLPLINCVRQVWAEDCEAVQGEEEGCQPRAHVLHVSGSRSELFFLSCFVIVCNHFS